MQNNQMFEDSQIAKNIANYRCPRYDEFPQFGIYMDQLINFLDNHLSIFSIPGEEKTITSTMINNYVKQKVIAPPEKKKYKKEQVIHLFVVGILKQVISISEIAKLIWLQTKQYETPTAYNFFCEELENSLKTTFETRHFTKSKFKFQDSPTPLSETARSALLSFANKIYVKQSLYYNS